MSQSDKIEDVVVKIQKVYLFLTCVGFVCALLILLGISDKYGPKEGLELICSASIFFALYYGLMRRKKWTIPFILFAVALGLYWEILSIFAPAESLGDIARKLISVLLFLFYAYQMLFFSKKEVKKYFRSKGPVLF